MGQTTHRASGGAISEVGNRKSDNSPKNNWGQLAFAKLPVDVLVFPIVTKTFPNTLQYNLTRNSVVA